jgi:hypothetical protein
MRSMTFHLSLRESAGSRSLDRLVEPSRCAASLAVVGRALGIHRPVGSEYFLIWRQRWPALTGTLPPHD